MTFSISFAHRNIHFSLLLMPRSDIMFQHFISISVQHANLLPFPDFTFNCYNMSLHSNCLFSSWNYIFLLQFLFAELTILLDQPSVVPQSSEDLLDVESLVQRGRGRRAFDGGQLHDLVRSIDNSVVHQSRAYTAKTTKTS